MKRSEMIDKLVRDIDIKIEDINERISCISGKTTSEYCFAYNFISDLKRDIILWEEIRKELIQMKVR